MRRAGLDETEDGVRHGGRILNNPKYADNTTHQEESEDSLHRKLRALKSAGEKVDLYLNIQKTKILSRSGI